MKGIFSQWSKILIWSLNFIYILSYMSNACLSIFDKIIYNLVLNITYLIFVIHILLCWQITLAPKLYILSKTGPHLFPKSGLQFSLIYLCFCGVYIFTSYLENKVRILVYVNYVLLYINLATIMWPASY